MRYKEDPGVKVVGTAILPLRKLNRDRGIVVDKHELLLMDMDKAPAVTVHSNGTLTYLQACRLFKHDVRVVLSRRVPEGPTFQENDGCNWIASAEVAARARGGARRLPVVLVAGLSYLSFRFKLVTTSACLPSRADLLGPYT